MLKALSKYLRKVRLAKRLRKKLRSMKNERRKGKSMRNGNAPSPYTKYGKRPYQYSFKSGKVYTGEAPTADKNSRAKMKQYA
jgi:hypothetical protein